MITTTENDPLFSAKRVKVSDLITTEMSISAGYEDAVNMHTFRAEYKGTPLDEDLCSLDSDYLGELRGVICHDFFYDDSAYDQADSISADMESLAAAALALKEQRFPRQGIVAFSAIFLETAWVAEPFRGNGQNLLRSFIRELLRITGHNHDSSVVIAQPVPMDLRTTTTDANGSVKDIRYLRHDSPEYETAYAGLLAANKRAGLKRRFTKFDNLYSWGLGSDF